MNERNEGDQDKMTANACLRNSEKNKLFGDLSCKVGVEVSGFCRKKVSWFFFESRFMKHEEREELTFLLE